MKDLSIVLVLLFLLFLNGCSDFSHKGTAENSKEESSYLDGGFEDEDVLSTCIGSLNDDGYRDSVVVKSADGNTFLSVFFGTKEGEYELFKKYQCEHYWDELVLNIHGDTLSCSGYGISYDFLYLNGDIKLVSYQSFAIGGPSYKLDFEKKKMTLVVEPPFEDIHEYIGDSTIYRSIDIPQDKIPVSYSISDAFNEKFRQYIIYDESFIYSKIEGFVNEINENAKTPKSERVDNDTILLFSEEIKYGDKTFALYMSIDRKGMTPILKAILEKEMCAMLDKENKYVYNNVKDVYDARKGEWLEACDFEHEHCYIDSYFIDKIGGRNDLFTYNIGNYHNDQYSGHGLEEERYVTYNKKTGMSFTWDMVKKEEGLHMLMVEGLMEFFKSENVEDMLLVEKYKKGEYIPFPENPPFIVNEKLVLQFHRYEITDVYVAGCPCSEISLDKVIPYLTAEGKDFLDISTSNVQKIE
ncbi:MAG: hypothetical protein MJZ28_08475 [Paludibacteraceae bacterium]|nr:hypothetical protein [Paludibacteraceae bacterium]